MVCMECIVCTPSIPALLAHAHPSTCPLVPFRFRPEVQPNREVGAGQPRKLVGKELLPKQVGVIVVPVGHHAGGEGARDDIVLVLGV